MRRIECGLSLIEELISDFIAAIIDVFTKAGVRYGLRTLLGLGAGAYIQAAFAVTQAVVVPTDGPNGLAFMLLSSSPIASYSFSSKLTHTSQPSSAAWR